MAWNGYLFKAVSTGTIFPHKYIDFGTWESTPNQREELKAYRDDNTRDLIRVTASGQKSVFQFKTRSNLTLAEKMEIQNFFTSAESDTTQRRITLQYWNDEINDYKTGDFYRPNLKFPIKRIENGTIIYDAITIDLIEY